MKIISTITVLFSLVSVTHGAEYLVKLKSIDAEAIANFQKAHGGTVSLVSEPGHVIKWVTTNPALSHLDDSQVEVFEPNRPLSLPKNPSLEANRKALLEAVRSGKLNFSNDGALVYPDNPEFKTASQAQEGADPKVSSSWGLENSSAKQAWLKGNQGKGVVVAVTDTGVDYNHEDLIANMWQNPKEIAGNGIDDDKNGFVDDIVGWDFAGNDNKPYDAILGLADVLLKSGNPGHGTHVAGVIASVLNNGKGSAGVAPKAKIMALRFINEEGKGNLEGGIKAVDYAVANGAHIINASWGGEKGEEDDTLLKEALKRAEQKGVLFVVAAGNGRLGVGYDNDADPKPIVPASYDYDNMVCVSAIDSSNAITKFSNWGAKTCKIGGAGAKVLSTIPGDRYQDTIVELGTLKITWDGTSMAAPHIAGAAAVIWSRDLKQTSKEVRLKLMEHAKATDSLKGKVFTNGRMDLSWIQ